MAKVHVKMEESSRSQAVIVPTDFSEHSQAAVNWACRWAIGTQAEVHLLHVVASEPTEDQARAILEQLLQEPQPQQALELVIHTRILVGVPSQQIVEYAARQEADLVVMGTQGRTGFARWALGSVAEHVIRTALCPVIVVKADDRDQSPPDQHGSTEGIATAAPPVFVEEVETNPTFDLIRRATNLRATDIHLDPGSDGEVVVRFRIDGRLEEYCRLDTRVAEPLQQQMKLAADLDIAEPFRPKEGRMRLPHSLTDLEVRITTSPVAGGEAIALRLFARDAVYFPLEQLGLSHRALECVQEMLKLGEGIILVTGPTGSGKTTTVYSMLETLGGGERNIVSIEDPVEFPVPFVRQMNVDERHGITMTSGLRTLLRMDPDVVFVGEIRDAEAASIAMRAASSGRYVFATMHTRDVAGTITTLRDLGIDNRSLSGNLAGIINQRLIRRLCHACARSVPIESDQRDLFQSHGIDAPLELWTAAGCDTCRGTGHRGRIGVFEAALATPQLAAAIARGAPEDELRELIRRTGSPSLTAAAFENVRDRNTSFSEARAMRWL